MKIVKHIFFISFFVSACFVNKKQDSPLAQKFVPSGEINQGKITKNDTLSSDAFIYKKGFVAGDTLYVQVQYGGGCGKADFLLRKISEGKKEIEFELLCTKNDPCKALINKQYYFLLDNKKCKKISVWANKKKVL